jgi:hypothetical protein
MKTFFFDIRDSSGATTIDMVGVQLPNAQAACREAEQALAGIIADDLHIGAEMKISVRNDCHQSIYCVVLTKLR